MDQNPGTSMVSSRNLRKVACLYKWEDVTPHGSSAQAVVVVTEVRAWLAPRPLAGHRSVCQAVARFGVRLLARGSAIEPIKHDEDVT